MRSRTTGYYYTNQFGDVVRIEDGNGTVLAKYSYDAWGKLYSSTGSLNSINPLRYRGYYYDTETGFYYLQSRYYDPTVSRFINADSYASTGQNFLGYNMFVYCGNNPVMRKDNQGDFWHIAIGAAVGAVVGAVGQIVTNVATGEKWSDGIGMAVLSGAASGALASSGVGLVGSVVGNAAINMVSNATSQVTKNGGFDNFDVGDMLIDGVIGGVAGAVGGSGMGKSTNLKFLNKNLSKKVFSGSKHIAKKATKYYLSQTKTLYKKFLINPILKASAVIATSLTAKRHLR